MAQIADTPTTSDQAGGGLQRIGDRLFDQDMDAGPRACDAVLGVELIGRRDDHGLGPRLVEQLPVIREDACAGLLGRDLLGVDVGDAGELVVAMLGQLAQMFAPDQSCADHANPDFCHLVHSVGFRPSRGSRGVWRRGPGLRASSWSR